MEKNVIVVDSEGNEYSRTWPKRAQGLVKKGRARFVDETTICLACPPDKDREDFIMEEKKELEMKAESEFVTERPLTAADVLDKVDALKEELGYLNSVIEQVQSSDQAKGKVLRQIVLARETTYQRLISFYEKVYEDVRPEAIKGEKRAQFLIEALQKMPPMVAGAPAPDYAELLMQLSNSL